LRKGRQVFGLAAFLRDAGRANSEMHYFSYLGDKLYCEGVSIQALARRHGTPLYVYSQATLSHHFQKLETALAPVEHEICFSVKTSSNRAVLRTLAGLGSWFDIVSGGELQRVMAAGGAPARCVFAGVGKTESEIEFALKRGVYCFNVESEPEMARINCIASRLRKTAPVAARVNPDVAAQTHAKITTGTYENKFGIALERIEGVYARAGRLKHIRLRGLQMHIGSQITSASPFEKAVRKTLPLVVRLKANYGLDFFSIGGGMGIVYKQALESGSPRWWEEMRGKSLLTPQRYAARLVPLLKPLGLRILIEPGRFIVGNAGLLVTRVEYVKRTGKKNFVIVDAAMNDLLRPALYGAYHEIVPVFRRSNSMIKADVVGPVCESSDCFCRGCCLPRVKEGDYLALMSAGAYGFVMASNYNTRPLAAEVLVNGNRSAVVRERQLASAIWAGEKLAPWLK
jgi:diaminopimelate decarboxylase